ncbi:MAG: hypothetical protein AAF490_21915 [Chloroflexota bacterium]
MYQKIFISEYHLDERSSPQDAKRVIELLAAEGWNVAYGDQPWQFDVVEKRALFEHSFLWACEVVRVQKRPFNEENMLELVRKRFNINKCLKPYEAQLLGNQAKWSEYLTWLLETPADVICKWLKPDNQKSASKD